MELKKTKEFIQKAKNFNLMKYMLIRKEGKILHEIDFQEETIESYKARSLAAQERIKEYKEDIIEREKQIVQLQKDLKKVKSVIKLD